MTAYLNAMRRYFDFAGRSTRAQYWLFELIFVVIFIVATVIDTASGANPTGRTPVIAAIVLLVHVVPNLSVTVRRLHDVNRSGWWILISVIPLIGGIVLLVFLCTPTQPPAGSGFVYGGGQGNGSRSQGQLEQLEKLSALRTSGAIDDAEFARMKSELLQGGR